MIGRMNPSLKMCMVRTKVTPLDYTFIDTDVIAIASGWLQLTFVPRERRKEHESMYWMV